MTWCQWGVETFVLSFTLLRFCLQCHCDKWVKEGDIAGSHHYPPVVAVTLAAQRRCRPTLQQLQEQSELPESRGEIRAEQSVVMILKMDRCCSFGLGNLKYRTR